MTFLTLPISFHAKMPSPASRGLMLKIIFGLSLIFVMSLLTLYVIQMGDLIGKSFVINSYEIEAEDLSGNNDSLQADSLSYYSLQEMENKINQMNFVMAEDISYIPIYSEQLVSNVQ